MGKPRPLSCRSHTCWIRRPKLLGGSWGIVSTSSKSKMVQTGSPQLEWIDRAILASKWESLFQSFKCNYPQCSPQGSKAAGPTASFLQSYPHAKHPISSYHIQIQTLSAHWDCTDPSGAGCNRPLWRKSQLGHSWDGVPISAKLSSPKPQASEAICSILSHVLHTSFLI
jgi:hypothetical protein